MNSSKLTRYEERVGRESAAHPAFGIRNSFPSCTRERKWHLPNFLKLRYYILVFN
jgi:hypothetical protein